LPPHSPIAREVKGITAVTNRLSTFLVLVGAVASLGASYRTENFIVEAPGEEVAKQIGDAAERHRKEQATLWLGREMPRWPEPCPLRVSITTTNPGGATTFSFDRGQVLSQSMHIEGPLDRLVNSVLVHEVTHTVFAHHLRQPVPRWADEGGAILSEDDIEHRRYEQNLRQLLKDGKTLPLARLFALKNYPPDVMSLYAQGHSVTRFLVEAGDRRKFLAFVADGMKDGWDKAAKGHYRYKDVGALEEAWLAWLQKKPAAEARPGIDPPPSVPPVPGPRPKGKDDPNKILIPALLEALKDEDGEVSYNAYLSLSALGSDAVPALLETLQGKDKEMRAFAASVLGHMAAEGKGDLARPALPALTKALKDEEKSVRRAAARAIRQILGGRDPDQKP
jgi:hypothetical protein